MDACLKEDKVTQCPQPRGPACAAAREGEDDARGDFRIQRSWADGCMTSTPHHVLRPARADNFNFCAFNVRKAFAGCTGDTAKQANAGSQSSPESEPGGMQLRVVVGVGRFIPCIGRSACPLSLPRAGYRPSSSPQNRYTTGSRMEDGANANAADWPFRQRRRRWTS
jgi:hypothetical protein